MLRDLRVLLAWRWGHLPFERSETKRRIEESGEFALKREGFLYVCTLHLPFERSENCRESRKLNYIEKGFFMYELCLALRAQTIFLFSKNLFLRKCRPHARGRGRGRAGGFSPSSGVKN